MTNIMVVDDSKAMRMIVKRTLRQAGFSDLKITEAGNGAEALIQLRSEVPDLILCDWNMPTMNGIDLLRAINKEAIQVKFGFVTSEAGAEMKSLAFGEGALFLIGKPFTAEKFKKILDAVLLGKGELPDEEVSRAPVALSGSEGDNQIPAPKHIDRLLANVLTKRPKVKKGKPIDMDMASISVAVYNRRDGSVGAITVLDIEGAACLGATLTGMPAVMVNESVQADEMDPPLLDAFREVANITASLYIDAGGPHVKLTEVYSAPKDPPAEILAMMAKPDRETHLELVFDGYGTGAVTFMAFNGVAAAAPAVAPVAPAVDPAAAAAAALAAQQAAAQQAAVAAAQQAAAQQAAAQQAAVQQAAVQQAAVQQAAAQQAAAQQAAAQQAAAQQAAAPQAAAQQPAAQQPATADGQKLARLQQLLTQQKAQLDQVVATHQAQILAFLKG